jgi:3-hydroxyisobutyrate dehydrogenase
MLLGTRALGLDPAVLAQVVNTSTGACWSAGVNNPCPGALPDKAPPCERGYEGGFATSLMLKVRPSVPPLKVVLIRRQDLKLAAQLGEAGQVRLPLSEATMRIYEQMIARDEQLAKKDFSATFEYLAAGKDV